jgi:hypothetical protein
MFCTLSEPQDALSAYQTPLQYKLAVQVCWVVTNWLWHNPVGNCRLAEIGYVKVSSALHHFVVC